MDVILWNKKEIACMDALNVCFICHSKTVTKIREMFMQVSQKLFQTSQKKTLWIFCFSQQLDTEFFFIVLSWCLLVAVPCTPCCLNTLVEEFDPKWCSEVRWCTAKWWSSVKLGGDRRHMADAPRVNLRWSVPKKFLTLDGCAKE